ncbi:MAG TPA: Lacal_2735 family protein [Salinimicrobium sp.]|nr:Lacal_2735 family protein [Salinimicrobium sp.]
MFRIFEPRTTLERLRDKYSRLMRHSYEIALTDKVRSDKINEKAQKILQEIKRMEDEKSEIQNSRDLK